MARPGVRRTGDRIRFLVRAWWLFARVEVGLRRSTLPAVARRLGIEIGAGRPQAPRPSNRDLIVTVHRVNRISRYWPFGDTCLRRCLVIGAMLAESRPRLVIGINPTTLRAGGLDAHAWLEIEGRSIDPMSADFSVMSFD